MSAATAPAAAIPRATYRLQLHRDFGFEAARAQVPYLARLGISHLYLSPILTARKGSMHGYDVVDHGAVNPELGGEDGLRALVAELRRHAMGLIVDIVPNHMAVGRDDNALWLDVLEWGRVSRYANFFDIDWDVPDPALQGRTGGRVLAPFLGKPYGEALAAGEVQLRFDAASGRCFFVYFEHRFPLAPTVYPALLRAGGDALADAAKAVREAVAGARRGRGDAYDDACRQLADTAHNSPAIRAAMQTLLTRFDGREPEGCERLHRLLERQHYRLAWWRTAADEINWRRFFDVIELAGVRIQESAAFEIVHATTLRLYREGLIDGVRVDHVDGLADPRGYCRKLRDRLTRLARERPATAPKGPAYFVVEKILAPGERLATDWKIDGTTGYTFMNEVGALLHDPRGEAPLTALWTEMTGRTGEFELEEKRARRRIPQDLLAADFNACAHALHAIARSQPATRDWTLFAIRRVLAELLVRFPVYRTYVDGNGRSEADAATMRETIEAARPACRPGDRPLLEVIDRWLGGEAPKDVTPPAARRARLRAIARFQQLSSPVAAKSVEDTAFYRHGRLLSRNEVGANPAVFSMSAEAFHAESAARRERFPRALLATATHDHKRGEDLRARLTVISEDPARWRGSVERWRERNAPLRRGEGSSAPDKTDETMLYQMLVAAWPPTLAPDDAAGLAALAERLGAWQLKAVREAKRHSGWAEPNIEYEDGCAEFLKTLLDPARSAEYLSELHTYAESLMPGGVANSLAQTLIKLTAPGVPDFYQGTEFWDFSLVDPDNRRPVDYAVRAAALDADAPLADRLGGWRDGRLKQGLIARVLALRAEWPEVFADGDYRPLTAEGPLAEHVFAFARVHRDGRAVLSVTTRFVSRLLAAGPARWGLDPSRWVDTVLRLPDDLSGRRWTEAVGDGAFASTDTLSLADLFARGSAIVLAAGPAGRRSH